MSDPVSNLKQELLAAADRQQGDGAVSVRRGRLRGHSGRQRVLLAAATLSVAAAVALLLTAPWNNSPGFLARAQAALTPPSGTIVHQKWELTSTSTDPACTVTRGPNEIWIDRTPPHRYRVLLNDLPPDPGNSDPRTLACASGTASELGGAFDTGETLRFVPPNTLTPNLLTFQFPLDPVADLREAISAGRADDEGKTELDGRIVERIRIDPPSACPFPPCRGEPVYWYVDPETFYPVETRGPGGINPPGGPFVRLHIVMRYLTFEYLPRTAANLELTDIRAQHPDASPAAPAG
jgi:hypothetical protein